jgi:2,3-bisphosphoglycerate-dependent phosphoglycerate mutase
MKGVSSSSPPRKVAFFLPDSFFQQDFHLKLFLIRHIERFDTLNEATSMDNNTHQIRHLSIDFTDHSISSNGVELSIDHKAVEVLQLLIAHAGHTVTTDQFMDQVWKDKPSAPEVVPAAVARLRKLFKMAGISDELIVTVHKVGYRYEPLAADVQQTDEPSFYDLLVRNKVNVLLYSIFFVMISVISISWMKQNTETAQQSQFSELQAIQPQTGELVTQIYILRHTEKADDSADSVLSQAGIERAKYWKKVLQHTEFDQVYTTDFKRNIQTAELIAESSSVKPELYHPMSFEVLKFLKLIEGKKVLIIGHSNTIPDMVNRLIGETRFPPMSHDNYNIMYVVTITPDGTASTVKLHIENPRPPGFD